MIGRRSRERWYDSTEPVELTFPEVVALNAFLDRMRQLERELHPPAGVQHRDGIIPPSNPPESR